MKNKLIAQIGPIPHPEGLDFTAETLIGDVLSRLLPYAFVLAGLFFFLNLILSGFKLLTSAGNPEGIQEAKGCLLTSIGGLLLILGSYWIAQIIQILFNIKIVGN